MKKKNVVGIYALLLALPLLWCFPASGQTMSNDSNPEKRLRSIEDRIALKELVDIFSNLADKKDVKAQTQLFTADATLETYRKEALASKLSGRQAMEDAFGAFLKNFQTVYHFNGQQTVTLDGDKASGVSYCLVTLIGEEGGKTLKTTIGIRYQDEYVRQNNRWLISRRISHFDWEEKQELKR